jgi:hypothetical protein
MWYDNHTEMEIGTTKYFSRGQQSLIRGFLLLFIGAILVWLFQSNFEYIFLVPGGREGELPLWIKGLTPLARGIFLNASFQIYYWIVALGLFLEFLRPQTRLAWNRDKLLTLLSGILLFDALITIYWYGIASGFANGWYDTMFYGLGFGVLFLLRVNPRSIGMRLLTWAKLIEGGGFFLGYLYIPGALDIWNSSRGLYHTTQGLAFMLGSLPFWTDFIVTIAVLIGVMHLIRQSGVRWFWINSFFAGSIIVGLGIGYLTSAL